MKTTDFIKEGYIADDADSMQKDHEVQMARQDCYNAAKNAIELHHLLKNVSEMQGLEGWVSEKLTLAADYLKTVKEYVEYNMLGANDDMPAFSFESAEKEFDKLLNEGLSEVSDETLTSYLSKVDADSQKHDKDPSKRSPEKRSKSVTGFSRAFNKLDARKEKVNEIDPRNYDSDWDYQAALNRKSKRYDDDDVDLPDDDDNFDPDELSNYEKYVNNLPEGKQKAVKESAGGISAGAFATGPAGGAGGKPGTGMPKKVSNVIKRNNPKFGKGIY